MSTRPRGFELCLLTVLRIAMGLLFLFSAYQKLKPEVPATATSAPVMAGYVAFEQQLLAYKVIDNPVLVKYLAFAIPWCETVVGVCLVTGIAVASAATLAVLMLMTFTGGVISVIWRGMPLSCGCFGKFHLFCDGQVSWCKVGENMVLIAACLPVAARMGCRDEAGKKVEGRKADA